VNRLRRVGGSVFLVLALLLVPGAATQASAAEFSPTTGEYFIDTDALTLTGPGGLVATGVDEGGIAVFAFDSVDIPFGAEFFAEGSRPLELRSAGAFTLAGLIDGSGFNALQETPGPYQGGPGGGAGGADGTEAGSGPGGGQVGSPERNGAGGGSFGGIGASGGVDSPGSGGAAGVLYGDLGLALQGGSGGGGGSEAGPNVGGGGGGGALKLSATSLTIGPSGGVFADGGNGNGANFGASGGGSGGGIILHAGTIDVAGIISAEGGDGGTGGCCGDGGGGGGGRIAYEYGTLVDAGEASVDGGESGVSGGFGHGDLSPQVAGLPGVITETQGPTGTTSAATAISPTGATLNGAVNPHGYATTYRFQLGTSTAYGTTVPAPDGAVGSDSSDHSLSQAVSGLAPSTTYHYRIVASGFGLTVPGADMTFTTAPKPTTAPKFSGVDISKGRVKVKNGKAWIELSSAVACQGEAALSMMPPKGKKGKAKGKGKGNAKGSAAKKKGRKPVAIGGASFSLTAGVKQIVKVPLSAAALKRLKEGKALPATATVTATDGFGVKETTKGNVSLKLVKKKGKGKGPKKRP
jgi:hypothetical protein